MRARVVVLLVLAGLGLGALGCVSLKRTPEARFFVLRSLAEPPAAPPAGAPVTLVGVLPVRIPGYIDRPQLVSWTAAGELRIDEFRRWGEPLDVGFTRTLAENLSALLPEHRVQRGPWRSSVVPRCRVDVELRVFGPQASGEVRLDGGWALLPAEDERPLARGRSSLKRGPLVIGTAGDNPGGEVEAMSELVAELSREIAAAVRVLPDEANAAPPAPSPTTLPRPR